MDSFLSASSSQPDMDSRVNGVSSPTVHDGRLLAEHSGGAPNVLLHPGMEMPAFALT